MARFLDDLARRRGLPETLVLDNGTELTSRAVLEWTNRTGVDWHYIAPGKPVQNAFIESFMYRRPRGRKCDVHRRARSCIRPVCAAHT